MTDESKFLRTAFIMGERVWRIVTIDGKPWAFQTHYDTGHMVQYTPDIRTMRHVFYGDVMQYYNPIERR